MANCISDSNRHKKKRAQCVVVVVVVAVVVLMDEMALVLKALVAYELDDPTPTIVKDRKFKSGPHEIHIGADISTSF
jgi:hypothetical protein